MEETKKSLEKKAAGYRAEVMRLRAENYKLRRNMDTLELERIDGALKALKALLDNTKPQLSAQRDCEIALIHIDLARAYILRALEEDKEDATAYYAAPCR